LIVDGGSRVQLCRVVMPMRALLVVALLLIPTLARAECADAPAPKVDWGRCFLDGRDFKGVDLSGVRMRDAQLMRADFTGARLAKVDATRAKFNATTLTGADFSGARLQEAEFSNAAAERAVFKGADLRSAKFVDADLKGADFTGALLRATDFFRADLSGARWIDGKTICAAGSIGSCQ
jgi:uncharacterized protein YjbI with pentapeptide repeats